MKKIYSAPELQIHSVQLKTIIALSFSGEAANPSGDVLDKEIFDVEIDELSEDFWGGEDKW